MSLLFVIGAQAIVVGVVLFALSPATGRRWPGSRTGVAVVRNVVLVVGIVLVAADLAGGQTPLSRTPNPVAGTVTSVDAGRAIYQANCAACHGVDAQGGGPLAGTTAVTPPSLTAHLTGHSDGDLYYWITNGLPGGMPAWESKLSETDRWNLVNFLRAVNAGAPAASGTPGPGSAPSGSAAPGSTPSGSPPPTATPAAFLLPIGSVLTMGTWLIAGLRRGRRRTRPSRRPGGGPSG